MLAGKTVPSQNSLRPIRPLKENNSSRVDIQLPIANKLGPASWVFLLKLFFYLHMF